MAPSSPWAAELSRWHLLLPLPGRLLCVGRDDSADSLLLVDAVGAFADKRSCDSFGQELANVAERLPDCPMSEIASHPPTARGGRRRGAAGFEEPPQSLPPAKKLLRLLDELTEIGLSNVVDLSTELDTVELQYEGHRVLVRDPLGGRATTADLPTPLRQSVSLRQLYRQFVDSVRAYAGHWDVLDTIDSQLCVLEPQKPARRDLHRRVQVTPTVSAVVTLDQTSALSLPRVSALGPQAEAEAVEAAVNANADAWYAAPDADFVTRLRHLLGVQSLPSAASAPASNADEEADDAGDCGICYDACDPSDSLAPTCDRCRRRFHRDCALEWLRALPDARLGFGRLHGDCPYCGCRITVRMEA